MSEKHAMIVYCLINTVNGKRYVGLTTQAVAVRMRQHCKKAFGRGNKSALHRAIEKYGFDSFSLIILEECETKEGVIEAERRWIEKFRCMAPRGYNLTTGGEHFTASEETRVRLSKALTGRKLSDVQKANLIASFECRRGKPLSEEHRRKISEASLGRSVSEEHRRKISEAMIGRPRSDETKRKISECAKGKVRSDEAKRNVSAAMKESWARRKARSISHSEEIVGSN